MCLIIVTAACKPVSVFYLQRTTAHSHENTTEEQVHTECWRESAVISLGLFSLEYWFTSSDEDQVWHSHNFFLWSHDSSYYWSICSGTFRNLKRHTYTSSVFPKGIHLNDTDAFPLAYFISFILTVFQELVNIILLQVILLVKVTYL